MDGADTLFPFPSLQPPVFGFGSGGGGFGAVAFSGVSGFGGFGAAASAGEGGKGRGGTMFECSDGLPFVSFRRPPAADPTQSSHPPWCGVLRSPMRDVLARWMGAPSVPLSLDPPLSPT